MENVVDVIDDKEQVFSEFDDKVVTFILRPLFEKLD